MSHKLINEDNMKEIEIILNKENDMTETNDIAANIINSTKENDMTETTTTEETNVETTVELNWFQKMCKKVADSFKAAWSWMVGVYTPLHAKITAWLAEQPIVNACLKGIGFYVGLDVVWATIYTIAYAEAAVAYGWSIGYLFWVLLSYFLYCSAIYLLIAAAVVGFIVLVLSLTSQWFTNHAIKENYNV